MRASSLVRNRRFLSFVAVWLATAGGALAQQPTRQSADEVLRRLEAAEARIAALEQLLERQTDQLAQQQQTLGERTTRLESTQAVEPLALPEQSPTRVVEAPPEKPITHNMVSFSINGLVQAWYAGGNQGFRETFRVRRAELYFNGAITDRGRWQVMIDPSKALALDTTSLSFNGAPVLTSVAVAQASRILQNASVTFDYIPKVRVSVGQFKLPLSLEGQQSSGRLETVERALFLSDRARSGNYGDVRDIGMLASGSLGTKVNFQAGVYNGVSESQNETDRNDQKALAGSLLAKPWTGFQLGGSGVWGNGGRDRIRRDRAGLDLLYQRGPWTVKSELMFGHDGPLSRMGYYGHLGYQVSKRVEGVFRFDSWDPDRSTDASAASVTERDYVAGLNIYLNQHSLKLQANYIRKTFATGALPDRNVFLVNSQTFW